MNDVVNVNEASKAAATKLSRQAVQTKTPHNYQFEGCPDTSLHHQKQVSALFSLFRACVKRLGASSLAFLVSPFPQK
jgi:hypothetical protein